jgi:hypothetical protein
MDEQDKDFNIIACRGCRTKPCRYFLWDREANPILVLSEDIGKPDCIFVANKLLGRFELSSIPKHTIEQTIANFRSKMRLDPFQTYSWKSPDMDPENGNRQNFLRLVEDGDIKIIRPPISQKQLERFKEWFEESEKLKQYNWLPPDSTIDFSDFVEDGAMVGVERPDLRSTPYQKPEGVSSTSVITHCRIVSISAHCSHGPRQIAGGGTLEVVPAISGDVIHLAAIMSEACGNHPKWEFSGYHSGSTSGTEVSFTARGWETPHPVMGILARILPKEYRVKANACEGTPRSLVVKAYPNNEISIKVDLNALVKKILKLKDAADAILKQWVPKFEWKLPNGVVEFKNSWEEDPNDWRAYWTWALSVGLEPLFGINVRVPLSPLASVPQYIRKYGDAYLYIEFDGSAKVTGAGERTSNGGKYTLSLTAEGVIKIQLGGQVHLMNDDCLKIDVNGSTSIKTTLHDHYYREGVSIGTHVDVDWEGIKGQISVTMLYGIVNVEQTWQLIDPRPLWKDEEWDIIRL